MKTYKIIFPDNVLNLLNVIGGSTITLHDYSQEVRLSKHNIISHNSIVSEANYLETYRDYPNEWYHEEISIMDKIDELVNSIMDVVESTGKNYIHIWDSGKIKYVIDTKRNISITKTQTVACNDIKSYIKKVFEYYRINSIDVELMDVIDVELEEISKYYVAYGRYEDTKDGCGKNGQLSRYLSEEEHKSYMGTKDNKNKVSQRLDTTMRLKG